MFTLCVHTLWSHSVSTLCGHNEWSHSVVTLCWHSVLTFCAHTRSSYSLLTLWAHMHGFSHSVYSSDLPFQPSHLGEPLTERDTNFFFFYSLWNFFEFLHSQVSQFRNLGSNIANAGWVDLFRLACYYLRITSRFFTCICIIIFKFTAPVIAQ